MKMKKYIFGFCALFATLTVTAQEKGSILIKNGTVITITDGVKENTDVLITNGKIKQIGQNLSVASNVKTVDAKGKFVMPGIIDAHSHLNTVSTNEATSPVTAEITIKESIDPNSEP